MKPTPTKPLKIREEIKQILDGIEPQGRGKPFVDALEALYKSHLQAEVEEILIFLDKLEMEQPQDLKTDNWRNWKYIRNSIVDKYGLTKQPIKGGEK